MPAYPHLPVDATPLLSGALDLLRGVLQAVAFWAAILLTAAYPVALALPEWVGTQTIAALIVTHGFALFVGHEHAQQ